MIQFDEHMFHMGPNHHLETYGYEQRPQQPRFLRFVVGFFLSVLQRSKQSLNPLRMGVNGFSWEMWLLFVP